MEPDQKSVLSAPGYAEGLARERLLRQTAFLDLTESIGAFEARQLTLTHYVILRISENPLLFGASASVSQLAAFLWIVSPGFSASAKERHRFLRGCRVLRKSSVFALTTNSALAYLADALMDQLPTAHGAGFEPEQLSDAASICDRFAVEYGWAPEVTMNVPLKCLLQFMKAQQIRVNSTLPPLKRVPLHNPSDFILCDHYARLNRN